MAELTDRQRLLVDLVGDIDPLTADAPATPTDGIFYSYCPQLWDRYADKALLSERLRELYVTRDGLDLILGVVAPEVNVSGQGSSLQLGQRAQTFLQRRRDAQAEIERIETQGAASAGGPVVVSIEAVVPIAAPSLFGADANSAFYSGSPYPTTRRVLPSPW